AFAGLTTGGAGSTYLTQDRFHTPYTARWTSTDPHTPPPGIGYDSLYTYTRNQPTLYVDPLGQWPCWVTWQCGGAGEDLKQAGLGVIDAGKQVARTAATPTPLLVSNLISSTQNAYAEGGLGLAVNQFNPVYGLLEHGTNVWDLANDGCIRQATTQGIYATTDAASTVAAGAGGVAVRAGRAGATASARTTAARSADGFVDLASSARRNHILYGDATGGGHLWPGLPGKTPFPRGWSADRVMHEISDVATDPNSTFKTGRGGSTIVTGTRDGVAIRVILRNGDIVTGHPTNMPRNP
ncbi:MAG: EndoU domain-containing protein, partial [Angustibacter sp.]